MDESQQPVHVATPTITFYEAFADDQSRESYEKVHDRLYLEKIVDAHECLRDARVIVVETPLWLLDPSTARLLYRTASIYFQHAALHVINALTDNDPRALTFNRLKACFLETCDPRKKEELERQIHAGFAANKFKTLRQRAEGLRNKSLAHFDLEYAMDSSLRASLRMTLKEVEELLGNAKELLHVLKPGVGMGFEVWSTGPERDMRYIVQQLMVDSRRLAMPEELPRPEAFAAIVKPWTSEQKRTFNDWRVKIGKDPIDFEGSLGDPTQEQEEAVWMRKWCRVPTPPIKE